MRRNPNLALSEMQIYQKNFEALLKSKNTAITTNIKEAYEKNQDSMLLNTFELCPSPPLLK